MRYLRKTKVKEQFWRKIDSGEFIIELYCFYGYCYNILEITLDTFLFIFFFFFFFFLNPGSSPTFTGFIPDKTAIKVTMSLCQKLCK